MVLDNLEGLLTIKEVGDNVATRAEVALISKGNNLCILLKGERPPPKDKMPPSTLYMYEGEGGQLFIDSKTNPSRERNITPFLDADTLGRMRARMSEAAYAHERPLGSQPDDIQDIESIFKAASAQKLIKKTFRQSALEGMRDTTSFITRSASTFDRALGGLPSTLTTQVVAPVVIGAANIGISTAFGSRKNIPYPKSSLIGQYLSSGYETKDGKKIDGLGTRINRSWESLKTNKYIGGAIRIADSAIKSAHKVTNSKALGRATSFTVIATGTVAATVATGGTILAIGAAMATGMTVAGTRAEIRRENAEIKQRHLMDLVTSSSKKEESLSQLRQANTNLNLHQILDLSDSKLRESKKPTQLHYMVTAGNFDVERKAATSMAAQSASIAADVLLMNIHGIATKSISTASGAISTAKTAMTEEEAKHHLYASIDKLEQIAPSMKDKRLADEAKRSLIEAKALELASKDKSFMEALSAGDQTKIKERFGQLKEKALLECKKEWSIEALAQKKAREDDIFVKLLEEAQGKPAHSPEMKELRERMELHQKAAEQEITNPAPKGFLSRMMHRIMLPENLYYNNQGPISRSFGQITRNLGRELFAERTSHNRANAVNNLCNSAEHLDRVVDRYTYGYQERAQNRTQQQTQTTQHTQTQQQTQQGVKAMENSFIQTERSTTHYFSSTRSKQNIAQNQQITGARH